MIAYIDLPLRGQHQNTGDEVLVIALVSLPLGSVEAVFVDEEGQLRQDKITNIKLNWRFQHKTRRWVDVDTGDELGSDDDDGESPD